MFRCIHRVFVCLGVKTNVQPDWWIAWGIRNLIMRILVTVRWVEIIWIKSFTIIKVIMILTEWKHLFFHKLKFFVCVRETHLIIFISWPLWSWLQWHLSYKRRQHGGSGGVRGDQDRKSGECFSYHSVPDQHVLEQTFSSCKNSVFSTRVSGFNQGILHNRTVQGTLNYLVVSDGLLVLTIASSNIITVTFSWACCFN